MNLGPWITIAFVDTALGIAGLALALLVVVGVLAALMLVLRLVRRSHPRAPTATAERADAVVPAPITPKARQCPQCGAVLPQGVLDGLCPACLLQQGASPDSGTQPKTAPFVPPAEVEIARLFPQLEVIELIGKGGMGAVYKARQPALDRLVALKILPAQAAGGVDFAERFNREARALAKLNHPNIVGVYEFGQVEALHYFIMEYVDGANLRQLERNGRLSPRQALQILPEICDALQYAHDEGVVHRDIKPENVLIDRKGRVKIADFGLAKILGRDPQDLRLTGAGQVMGTPHYMAPEQIEHPLDVDHRADIYSLGVVFYEMLTGELPLGRFAPPSRKVRIDVRLDEVVLRTLEKEPERRYQHASEVGTAVDTIAHTLPQSSGQPEPQRGREVLGQPLPGWLRWSPFQPARVREICTHLTDAEEREAMKRGLLFGFWNAATCFVPFFVVMGVPAPLGWILGAGVFLLGLSFYPLWRRMEREQLCATAWGRQQGITPDQLKGSAGRRWPPPLVVVRDGRRVIHWTGVVWLAALLTFAAAVAVAVLSIYHAGPTPLHLRSSLAAVLAVVVPLTVLPILALWTRSSPVDQLPRLGGPEPGPEGTPGGSPPQASRLPRLVVVGRRDGQAVIHWPGAMRSFVLALALAEAGAVLASWLLMGRIDSRVVGLALMGAVVFTWSSIGFGLRTPVEQLTVLDGPGGTAAKIAVIIFAVVMATLMLMAALLLLYVALARRGSATARAPVAPHSVPVPSPRRNTVSTVRCTVDKATVDYEVDDAHEIVLFVGTEALGWSSWHAGTYTGRATVEASDRLQMEDGSLGRGFIFQTRGARHYVAITPDGPVPFGELVFRPDAESTQEAGIFTFADIHQTDGTRVPISVRVRPAWRFGPVIEKVIGTEDADDQGLVFFDLEAGRSCRPPFPLKLLPGRAPAFVDLTPELRQWIRAQGMDILLLLGATTWSMMTLQMQEEFAGQLADWEAVSPAKVVAGFAAKDAVGLVRGEVPASSSGHSYSDGFGSFSACRTRSNTMGVYQFEGVSNSTRRGVSLRYKLVRLPAAALPEGQ